MPLAEPLSPEQRLLVEGSMQPSTSSVESQVHAAREADQQRRLREYQEAQGVEGLKQAAYQAIPAIGMASLARPMSSQIDSGVARGVANKQSQYASQAERHRLMSAAKGAPPPVPPAGFRTRASGTTHSLPEMTQSTQATRATGTGITTPVEPVTGVTTPLPGETSATGVRRPATGTGVTRAGGVTRPTVVTQAPLGQALSNADIASMAAADAEKAAHRVAFDKWATSEVGRGGAHARAATALEEEAIPAVARQGARLSNLGRMAGAGLQAAAPYAMTYLEAALGYDKTQDPAERLRWMAATAYRRPLDPRDLNDATRAWLQSEPGVSADLYGQGVLSDALYREVTGGP